MKLDNLTPYDNLTFLLKGSYGFGKTIAAASFAKLGPIHISYWDKKAPIELKMFFQKHAPHLLRNIEYDVYNSQNANEYLNKMMDLAKSCRYVAEINDSVTTMTSAAVNWSLGFRDTKEKNKDRIVPGFDEYKVETSLVTQALDICRALPCHVIWTAHPLPQMKIEDKDGKVGKISKTNSIVTYGNKVAGIIPGQFSEIYHFSKRSDWDGAKNKAVTKYYVSTEQVGDEYAKSNIGLNCEMEITDQLFYDVWKIEVKKLEDKNNEVKQPISGEANNPFANISNKQENKSDYSNLTNQSNQPKNPLRPWEN